MKFCSQCSSSDLERSIPLGSIGLRFVCHSCGFIHYARHSIVAGCLATNAGRVLMCKRAIEPGIGLWTIPAGYVELGETLEEGAIRETFEEARARVQDLRLFAIYNLPSFGELYVLYQSQLVSLAPGPGAESLETALVGPDEIPWQSLGFPTIREALRSWCVMRGSAPTQVLTADFFWGPEGAVRVRRG